MSAARTVPWLAAIKRRAETANFSPNDEGGLLFNDPEVGVEWPIPEGMELIMSEKDQNWGGLSSLKK